MEKCLEKWRCEECAKYIKSAFNDKHLRVPSCCANAIHFLFDDFSLFRLDVIVSEYRCSRLRPWKHPRIDSMADFPSLVQRNETKGLLHSIRLRCHWRRHYAGLANQVTASLFMGKGRRRSCRLPVPLSARDDEKEKAKQWAALREAFLSDRQVHLRVCHRCSVLEKKFGTFDRR